MTIYSALGEMRRLVRASLALIRFPKAHLQFHSCISPCKIHALYALFTRPHARFRLIKNKTMGIALIDLSKFNSSAEYIATVKKKDYAAHRARQARNRGYRVRRINRNDHIDEIFRIHTSAEARQGRPMDPHYLTLQTEYDDSAPLRCFGVFHRDGHLMAYCSFGIYGNFAATDRLLGYKDKDGAMYLLLLEIICSLIDQRAAHYFMYDTFLGAREGLQSFKRRVGFQPYRVSYSIH
jgi:hypothetical protein